MNCWASAHSSASISLPTSSFLLLSHPTSRDPNPAPLLMALLGAICLVVEEAGPFPNAAKADGTLRLVGCSLGGASAGIISASSRA